MGDLIHLLRMRVHQVLHTQIVLANELVTLFFPDPAGLELSALHGLNFFIMALGFVLPLVVFSLFGLAQLELPEFASLMMLNLEVFDFS